MCIAPGTFKLFALQRIQYSKTDSDVIAKMKGTFQERPKKVKPPTNRDEEAPRKKKKSKVCFRMSTSNWKLT